MSLKLTPLANGAEGLFVKNNRFKTTLISFNFYLPLKKETAALYALLPFILTSCNAKYPEFSKLNYKLSKLYGARLDASTEKYGDYQLLKMTVSVINDRYALDEESLVKRASDLLLNLVFEPSVIDGAFLDNDIEREKRKAIEHIKGEYSEKRVFAKNRLIEEMYKDEDYGVAKCGSVEDVEAIDGKSLYNAWLNMLKSAFVRVHIVGAAMPTGLFDSIAEKFSAIERDNIPDCTVSMPTSEAKAVKRITDTQAINQGKLVMGFSSKMFGNDDNSLPLLVMGDIFGGGPYSRLFSNVREKMSLCYYCSAATIRQKGLLTVESGVEADNAEKAETEILNQLKIVQNGEFSDFEFESSIKSICGSLLTYSDSLNTLDMWYSLKANNKNLYSPDDIADKVKAVTREEVIEVAKAVKLHTVYKLMPQNNKEVEE